METLLNLQLRPKGPMSRPKLLSDYQSVIQSIPANSTTDKYSFIPTTAVLEVLADNNWLPTTVLESGTKNPNYQGYQKHIVRLENKQINQELGLVTEIPEIVLINSHDAKTSFKLMLGIYRLVCSNGLMVGDTFEERRITHMGYTTELVQDAIKRITQIAPDTMQRVGTFKNIILDNKEQIAFAESAIEMIFDEEKRQFVKPDAILKTHRSADQGNDLWTTFNKVQENIIRGRYKLQDGFKRTKAREVKSLDKNVAINRGLWSLTEKMAELKNN